MIAVAKPGRRRALVEYEARHRPARITEDLPQPELPWTMTSASRVKRRRRSATMRSRPKKMGHSDGSNGRRPGRARRQRHSIAVVADGGGRGSHATSSSALAALSWAAAP